MDQSHPLLRDFRNFLYYIWMELGLPDPTPVQYDIALYLQHGPRRRMIEAFRGVGKSWETAAYVLWCLLKDPEERFMVVSANKERADSFSTFCKRLIREIPLLKHLKAKDDQRDSNVAFDVGPSSPHQAPSVKSVGITGQLTGSRATKIVVDDIETPKNSMTQLQRDRIAELIKEFDAVLTPGGQIIYLGTPQCEMSVYNTLTTRGYDMKIWPSQVPKAEDVIKYRGNLAQMVIDRVDAGDAGAPMDPARFDMEDLMEREASYGRSGYALQFMLDTSLSDADKYPLRLSDLIIHAADDKVAPLTIAWGDGPEQTINDIQHVGLVGDHYNRPIFVDKDFRDYTGSVLFIDPSGRGKDETGYAVVKMLHGYLWLTEAGGLKGGYDDDTLKALCHVAKRNHVNIVQVEPNFGDGMFNELIKPWLVKIYPVAVEDGPRASMQKEQRIIASLEPVMNQHRLVVDPKVIKKDLEVDDPNQSLFYQMTRLTKERGALRKDDRLDALAGAVAYWTEMMSQDAVKQAEVHRDTLLQGELDTFMEHVLGGPQETGGGWCDRP